MCRFTGLKHRDYSPSRSTTMSYWRRLPTIYEATDVEMAEEIEASEKGEQRHVIETEQLGEYGLLPVTKKNKRSEPRRQRNARCIVPSFSKSDFIEKDASRSHQQIQDEWRHLLSTPYADFFPQNVESSFIDNNFTRSRKRTLGKISNKDAQACKFSEITAWLELFG